jgi:RimJ/RimL family protein N-acetyltransferase
LEGRLREQVWVQTHHHDLLCFGLLRREWLATSCAEG